MLCVAILAAKLTFLCAPLSSPAFGWKGWGDARTHNRPEAGLLGPSLIPSAGEKEGVARMGEEVEECCPEPNTMAPVPPRPFAPRRLFFVFVVRADREYGLAVFSSFWVKNETPPPEIGQATSSSWCSNVNIRDFCKVTRVSVCAGGGGDPRWATKHRNTLQDARPASSIGGRPHLRGHRLGSYTLRTGGSRLALGSQLAAGSSVPCAPAMLSCTSCPFRCPGSQGPTAHNNVAPCDASTLPPPIFFPTCPHAGAAPMGKAGAGPDALSDLAVLLYYRSPRVQLSLSRVGPQFDEPGRFPSPMQRICTAVEDVNLRIVNQSEAERVLRRLANHVGQLLFLVVSWTTLPPEVPGGSLFLVVLVVP